MRKLVVLGLLSCASPSFSSQLCFHDGGFVCCYPGPPCDIYLPVGWIGFQTGQIGPSSCSSDASYYAFLTLSSSPADPYVNSGEIPSDGRLYLWNVGPPSEGP